MKLKDYKEGDIIFESIWKTIAVTTISGLFVFSAFTFVDKKESPFYFWATLLLFGFGLVHGLYRLLNPKTLFIKPGSKLAKEYGEIDFQRRYNDVRIIEYLNNGFIINLEQGKKQINWKWIKSIVAYKKDVYSYDIICLDLFCINGEGFSINEETPGWYQFLEKTKFYFPSIDKNWEIEITTPTFEAKLTLLYDQQNRSLPEVVNEFYKE